MTDPCDSAGKYRISTVIIAQDDESRIAGAIASCQSFSDEIVVIDGGSKDGTIRISEQLGCKVWMNPWPGYAKQRMYGSEQAAHDWIFFIDTDEVVSESLAESILERKKELSDGSRAYAVIRIGDFLGRWVGRGESLVRLYNRKHVQIKDTVVHETPDVAADHVIHLQGTLWHYGFRSISDHVRRFNTYTDLEAESAVSAGKSFSILRLVYRPPLRFLQKYIWQGLYRKGIPGFAVAVFWAMYEFMACLKHYEKLKVHKRAKLGHQEEETLKEGKTYAIQ